MKYLNQVSTDAECVQQDYNVVYFSDESGKIVIKEKETPIEYEYVDLGLSSGTKWATCNLGATTPEGYGQYFQWGETVGHTEDPTSGTTSYTYTWATSPCNGGNEEYNEEAVAAWDAVHLTNGVLNSDVDAASVNMGGKWHMPTVRQIQELFDNTTNEWVEDYNGTGVNGYKFTNKSDSSKYIFIPASGGCFGSSISSVGEFGYVFSSSVGSAQYVPILLFNLSGGGVEENYVRADGTTLRGVIG